MPAFARYIGVDYSGAQTPEAPLSGLRAYLATQHAPPREQRPPQRHWSRRDLALWLNQVFSEATPTLAAIDHSFSFPLDYFHRYGLPTWDLFLDDFGRNWPTHTPAATVQQFRAANARTGPANSRRLCEVKARAKSVFHFDVPGSVAKSTHAGLPWLLHLRHALGPRLHFWPFDGWHIPPGRSAIAEIYPTLCRAAFPAPALTPDQQDAYAACAWLRHHDLNNSLEAFLRPALTQPELEAARLEGWILGVR